MIITIIIFRSRRHLRKSNCVAAYKLKIYTGSIMFNIYSINYVDLSSRAKIDLYTLRKSTFYDRLGWAVTCINGMENDQFDDVQTNYILGVVDQEIICGTRIIPMSNANMLEKTFFSFFKDIEIPEGKYIESTRFFVDKMRTRNLLEYNFPVTKILFLSLLNFARKHQYEGIIAVASHAMMQIIEQSGWKITKLKTGQSEKGEPVHLLLGHIDDESCRKLKEEILDKEKKLPQTLLEQWPFVLNKL